MEPNPAELARVTSLARSYHACAISSPRRRSTSMKTTGEPLPSRVQIAANSAS